MEQGLFLIQLAKYEDSNGLNGHCFPEHGSWRDSLTKLKITGINSSGRNDNLLGIALDETSYSKWADSEERYFGKYGEERL